MPFDSETYIGPVTAPEVPQISEAVPIARQFKALPSEILEAAANLISQPDRWARGFLEDARGRVCAVGAMSKIMRELPEDRRSPGAMGSAMVYANRAAPGGDIVIFNDHRASGAHDVAATLRYAAKRARMEGQ